MAFNLVPGNKPQIHVTKSDMEKLRNLAFAALSAPDVADELLGELDRAVTVDDGLAGKYIGLGSTATYVTSDGTQNTVSLVLPVDADIEAGRVSALTPVGVALLGLAEGQQIDWRARNGRTISLTVKAVHGPEGH